MVKGVDIEQFARLDNGACHRHIVRAGSRITTGMVVRHHDGRSQSLDGGAEDLAHPHLRGIHRALIDLHDVQHTVAPVQQEHAQVFFFQQAHLGLHQRGRIGRTVDRGAFLVQADSVADPG